MEDAGLRAHVTFRTTDAQYKVLAASLIIPLASSTGDLSALINHMLGNEEGLAFMFFIDGSLITGKLAESVGRLGISLESQIVIDYSLASELPEEKRQDRLPDWVRTVRASSAPSCLAGSFDACIRLYDSHKPPGAGPSAIFAGHSSAVTCLEWVGSADRDHFVSGSNDRTLRLWDLNGAEAPCKAVMEGHSGTIQSLAVGPNRLVVSGDYDGTIGFWSADPSKAQMADTKQAASLRKTKKGASRTKATALPTHNEPVIKADSFVEGHSNGPVTSLIVDKRLGSRLYSSGYDQQIRCWDLEVCKASPGGWKTGGSISTMAMCPFDGSLVVANPDGSVRFIDGRASEATFAVPGAKLHSGWINALAWSPTSEHLFCSAAADMKVCLWDRRGLASGPLRVLSDSGHKMLALDWSPHGIYFGGEDCILHTCS